MLTHKLVLLDSNTNKAWLAADIFLRSSTKSEKGKLNLQKNSSNWCLCKRSIFLKRRKFKQNKFQVDSLPNLLLLCVWLPIEIVFSIDAAKIFFFVIKKTDWIDNRSKIFQLLLMIQFTFIAMMTLTTF